MTETIKEKSCGIIVYKEDLGTREYLILKYPEGHFDFPKGHVEEGEDDHTTALRELEEETGITEVEFAPNFKEKMSYHYVRADQKYFKEVYFFLAKTVQNKVKLSHEHLESKWLPYKEALQTVTFKNAKELLSKAQKFLTME
jgi:bis(5'-nucleosidyl)-tetraphosphatase